MEKKASDLFQEIEHAVRKREITKVKTLTTRFIKMNHASPASRVQVSEWHRRLSDFASAFRWSKLSCPLTWNATPDDERELFLQNTRILNLLGASSYALNALKHIPKSFEHRFRNYIVSIYFSNYQFEKAATLLQEYRSAKPSDLTYTEQLKLLNLADCDFGLGNLDSAESIYESLVNASPSMTEAQTLTAIAHQAFAQLLIERNQIEKAWKHLNASSQLFHRNDRTQDRGMLFKWMGIASIKQSRVSEARKFLKEAWSLLYRPGFKPEAWMELYYWQGMIDWTENANVIPTPWLRLLVYPTSHFPWIDQIRKKISSLPKRIHFSVNRHSLSIIQKKYGRIRFSTNEFYHRKKITLGIKQPEQMLGFLILSGSAGIPQYRLIESLWPDEHQTFAEKQKRIEQVTFRARSSFKSISWKDFHFSLPTSVPFECEWDFESTISGGGFLETHPTFFRKDVEAYYGMSERSARTTCEGWKKNKLIDVSKTRNQWKTLKS